jgi:hypothetical protein
MGSKPRLIGASQVLVPRVSGGSRRPAGAEIVLGGVW